MKSLDNEELQMYRSGNRKKDSEPPKNDEERFTRKSSSLAYKRFSNTARMSSAKSLKKSAFTRSKKSVNVIEGHEQQEKRLISRLETLFAKMNDFELRAQAYKLNRLELTKKAVNFQVERNKRLRDRNSLFLDNN